MNPRLAPLMLIVLGACNLVHAQEQRRVSFITCPVYRDTDAGKKSGCWLADDRASGSRYDVSLAPTKPDWNREILVEGRITSGSQDACGGIVLDPVRVSVLPGVCVPKMLPAEGHPGRKFVLPPRNLRPPGEPRPQPQRPYTDKIFYLFYDFNSDFLVYQLDDFFLDRAVSYIRAVSPRKITVTGFAATGAMTVSGRELREPPSIAQQRAAMIGESLRRLGVPAEIMQLKWQSASGPVNVEEADGLPQSSRRRVEIVVEM